MLPFPGTVFLSSADRSPLDLEIHRLCFMKSFARWLSASPIFSSARKNLVENEKDWNFTLSKWQKLSVGSYMILRDYAADLFPPRYEDEETTFEAERGYYTKIETLGKSAQAVDVEEMRKPFWQGPLGVKYLRSAIDVMSTLQSHSIAPPARLLEVGCGCGWLAEFNAAAGYHVTASTLDPTAEDMVQRRNQSLLAKGLTTTMEFRVAAMEHVDRELSDSPPFDAAYVYEALHHAHDWRQSFKAIHACLRPGGWFFIFNEPNLIHTFVSYRVGVLSNTHEIGMNAAAMKNHLREIGFDQVETLRHRFHGYVKPIWIAARKAH